MTNDKARRDRRAGVIGVFMLMGACVFIGFSVVLVWFAVLKWAVDYLFQ